MTFYIPPIFLFGNKVRHIRNNQEKNKAEYKTAIETGIQIENRNIKRIKELEEENKELRKENELLKECNIRNYTSRSRTDDMNLKLLKENKKLEEENERLKEVYDTCNIDSINRAFKIGNLEMENKKLKESLDIATKCSCKEEDGIIRLSEENKRLKEELKWYKKQYEHSMGED